MTEAGPSDAPRQHGLAVVVEEWFQGQALAAAVRRAHWPRLESRVEATVDAWLALLEHSATKATFFVDAFVAERRPALVARIAASGHELRGDRVEDALTQEPARSKNKCAHRQRSDHQVSLAQEVAAVAPRSPQAGPSPSSRTG